ncbi:helix-turn-helix domain-containing protein [Alloyangia pacifica]|uniref:helix-turn-helix domain-containing protein n=1 Tax=Alloyangia pacifica TaxID=311180 RepID=UPI001CFE82C5|nr:helix-turn-helix domain-containing protein [Alloyangia pacifica]
MSHAATVWAIQQRGLKPATKLVLWQLADRHNRDTQRCDPSQALLAHDCEMSRSTVNLHLRELEKHRLIRRIRRVDPQTRRQISTYYELAFDTDLAPCDDDADEAPEARQKTSPKAPKAVEPSPKSGLGAVSEKTRKPCPKKAESRVRKSDTNLVIEPGKEPYAREALSPLQSKAQLILTGKPFLCTAISSVAARECIVAGLVTPEDCRAAGVQP